MEKIISKFGPILATLALLVATLSANNVCAHMFHQPELPTAAKKLRKF